MKKTFAWLVLLSALSLFLVWPFFKAGLPVTDDGLWAVVRQGAMHRALMGGHFPVRWAGQLNFGYGYPLFLFAYPLPYYLGEFFNLLGFGLVGSVKTLFILSTVFSGWLMFWLGRELFGPKGGLLSAVFYLFAPFRMVDLFVRGSLGESLAFAFYPFLLLVLLKGARRGGLWLVLGALAWGGFLLTHNVSVLLFSPFLLAWGLFLTRLAPRVRRGSFLRNLTLSLFLGFGLSAFFLVPALAEKNRIALAQRPLADKGRHFVGLSQLLLPSWGYGAPGSQDAFSFQLGGVHLGGAFLAGAFWLVGKKKNKTPASSYFGFAAASLAVTVLLMLPIASRFWQVTPLFSEIDFPWRLLGPASFFLSLSVGYLGTQKRFFPAAMVLAVLAIVVNMGYAKPKGLIDYGDDYYLTNEATTTSADELMPKWVGEKPTARAEKRVEILSGQGSIDQLTPGAVKIAFTTESQEELDLQINTIYFPGWEVRVDNQPRTPAYNNRQGLIRLKVPAGTHRVAAEFKETPLRKTSNLTSLASLLIVGFLAVKKRNQ